MTSGQRACRRMIQALVLFFTITNGMLQAQTPDEFNPNPTNGNPTIITSFGVQLDGKLLIGGRFENISGSSKKTLARFLENGTLDSTFSAPGSTGSTVNTLGIRLGGVSLIGGNSFGMISNEHYYAALLQTNGTVDVTFRPNPNNEVYSMVMQSDGKAVYGGMFTGWRFITRNRIARINADGSLDSTYNPNANNVVYTLVALPDDSILAGGSFTTIGGQLRSRIALLQANGIVDTNFNAGADGVVECMALQPDGKIIVGGRFTNLCGESRKYIGRLHRDGTLDETFQTEANDWITSIALQADGRILVSGRFTAINGEARGYVARLLPSGELDQSFNIAANSAIYGVGLQWDGKVLLGGSFTNIGGVTRSAFARLNNTHPAEQNLAFTNASVVFALNGTSPQFSRVSFDVSTNGQGWFSLEPGTFQEGAWRANANSDLPENATIRVRGVIACGYRNASTWSFESIIGPPVIVTQLVPRTNNPATTATFSTQAEGIRPMSYRWFKDEIEILNGGKISGADTATLTLSNVFGNEGGDYTVVISNAGGSVTSLVAKLTVNDPLITTNPANQTVSAGQTMSFGLSAIGTSLSYQWRQNGQELSGRTASTLTINNSQASHAGFYDVVVSSSFSSTTSAVAIATVNVSTLDLYNPNGVGTGVYALAQQPDGQVFVGGDFSTIGTQGRSRLARLSVMGIADVNFDPSADLPIFTLGLQEDGKMLVGGFLRKLNGYPRSYFGRVNPDGSLDSAFNPYPTNGVTFPGVYGTAVQDDDKIVIAGDFRTIAGGVRTNIARLNRDGSLDSAFDSWANDIIYPIILQPDGKIILAGNFTQLRGVPRVGIGRLNSDGTVDTSFNPGVNGLIVALAVQPDGKIIVGGSFTSLAGVTCTNIGRLNSDGSFDHSFTAAANAIVRSFALQADGKIVFGGNFTVLSTQPRSHLGRLLPDGTADLSFNPAVNTNVFSVAIQSDGKILLGGEFSTVSGQTRNRIARLNNTEPAMEEMSFDGSTITWLRSGTAPEVWKTVFDISTDGTSWMRVGVGQRIQNGWQISGLDFPTNTSIRARGFVTGGRYSASTWFVEKTIGPAVLAPPTIIVQPQGSTNAAGSIVFFSVEAQGSGPLSYTWMKNGTNLSSSPTIIGPNKMTLMLSNVFAPSTGDYSVRISNAVGAITSAVAQLTVIDPFIASHPAHRTNNAGASVSFSVTATGNGLNYQWFRNETALTNGGKIAGATSSTLSLNNVLGGDQGDYSVAVSNTYGSITSSLARLVIFEPVINSQPADRFAHAGQSVTLSVTAAGTDPLYQWRKDGVEIAGASNTSLVFTNIQASDHGSYDVVVSTSFGTVTSAIARVSVNGIFPDAFNPGANSSVWVMAPLPDGRILAGGSFTSIGGQLRNYLALLNSDGSVETNFNANIAPVSGAGVKAIGIQADGRILVGGSLFNSVSGQPRTNFARLNSDGTLDSSFAIHPNSSVQSLAIQADGNILIAGWFTNIAGQLRHRLARFNADGELDESFNPNINDAVTTLAIQADQKILLAGSFTNVSGVARSRVARLHSDGTVDTEFTFSTNGITCMAIQSDDKILIGGRFSGFFSGARNNLARLLPSGEIDFAFAPDISLGAPPSINSIALQADGKIIIGGYFQFVNGITRSNIARLDVDGTLDPIFGPGSSAGMSTEVASVSLQSDGNILVSGNFSTMAGVPRNRIARLSNIGYAEDYLSRNGGTLTWNRSGTAPEILQATFDVSEDGLAWTKFGSASRTSTGWELQNVPQKNRFLRARGHVAGGYQNGSSWFLEIEAEFPSGPPVILFDGQFGYSGNQFGFNISGANGQTVVIEGSTDLQQWVPIMTNTFGSGSIFFSDFEALPKRFYRLSNP